MSNLGIDFGRVIVGTADSANAEDTHFGDYVPYQGMSSAVAPQAITVIRQLVEQFAGQVWIISKASEPTQRKTLAWLDDSDFYQQTGLRRGNIRFCLQRSEKAVHCRELGITHMIDDRLEVHQAIRDIVANLYLFGPQDNEIPGWVVHTPDWRAVATHLLGVDAQRLTGLGRTPKT